MLQDPSAAIRPPNATHTYNTHTHSLSLTDRIPGVDLPVNYLSIQCGKYPSTLGMPDVTLLRCDLLALAGSICGSVRHPLSILLAYRTPVSRNHRMQPAFSL